jgi:hypothetical protein
MKKWIALQWFSPRDAALVTFIRWAWCITLALEFLGLAYEHYTLRNSHFWFAHDGFNFVCWLGLPGMWVIDALGLTASLACLAGWRWRLTGAIALFCFSWGWLVDTSIYNNHFYLYSLLGGALLCMDAGQWKPRFHSGEATTRVVSTSWVPGWQVWLLRFFVWMAYFYGALAKLNPDWLAGYPMKLWLPGTQLPLHTEWLDELFRSNALAYFFTYGGLLFDAVVPFMLYSPALRRWTLPPAIFFHLTNSFVWNIGTFPFAMLALTTVFFPGAPRKITYWMQCLWARIMSYQVPTGPSIWKKPETAQIPNASRLRVTYFAAAFVIVQLALPFRHHLYPGHVDWTGEGHYFAWRMMLVQAHLQVSLYYRIPPDSNWTPLRIHNHLHISQVNQLKRKPDHLVLFARWWAEHAADSLGLPADRMPEVSAHITKSVNGRPYAQVFSPDANLASLYRSWLFHTPYYLPYNDSIPPGQR